MVKPFWITSTKRSTPRQPRRRFAWLTAALLGGFLPLAFLSEAQAFPILGGLLRGLGRLLGGLLVEQPPPGVRGASQ